jgi:steroid delta-isomerase
MPTLPERIMQVFATYHLRREKVLGDIDALYAPDVHFIDPFNDVHGKDHFIRINRNLLTELEDMRFDDLELVGDEPHFMLTWTCTIRPRVGLTIIAPGVSELRSSNGLVTFHRDHWDALGAIAGSIPGVRTVYSRLTARLFGD